MGDTGFDSRASAFGARVFVATLIFAAPILTIVALVVVALNDRLWRFFADSVATNILVPYGWALGSALLVLSFAALVGYVAMLIARSREGTGPDSPRT